MSTEELHTSKHFNLQQLTAGIFAAIHKPGGAAYSNAGIIDLGDRTLVVDAFNSIHAGGDLRKAAECLLNRSIQALILTHVHTDHWVGVTAFDPSTAFITTHPTSQEYNEWAQELLDEFQKPEEWEEWIKTTEQQLEFEKDERVRQSLQTSIERTRTMMAEMTGYQPRYPDTVLEAPQIFEGPKRKAEVRSFGAGHSKDDVVVLLPDDRIAFIGDIGFFNTQPYMGFCDLDLWRDQVKFFQDSDFETFIPGHGPVGTKEDIILQMEYFDTLENLIGNVVNAGGSSEEAMQVALPEPFDGWLFGGMARFEVNVRYFYERLGGELLEA